MCGTVSYLYVVIRLWYLWLWYKFACGILVVLWYSCDMCGTVSYLYVVIRLWYLWLWYLRVVFLWSCGIPVTCVVYCVIQQKYNNKFHCLSCCNVYVYSYIVSIKINKNKIHVTEKNIYKKMEMILQLYSFRKNLEN